MAFPVFEPLEEPAPAEPAQLAQSPALATELPQTIAAPAQGSTPIFEPLANTPEELAQIKPADTGPISKTESFLRGVPEGFAFGFDDKLGFDKERREASKKQNPWTHFLGEAVGAVAPMAVATPLAAVKGAGLLARGARAAAAPFTVGETATVGQSALQGSKIGLSYGTLSGAGHADVKPTDSVGEAAWKRLQAGAIGGVEGGILGVPLGVAGHGLGKLVSAAMSRAIPEIQDVLKTASSSELQAIREIMRSAGQDKYTMEDLVALQQRLRDPNQAHLYQGLNLIEALETKPLQASPITNELTMPVRASPAMNATMQDAANLAGAGRHDAAQAFATRKSEMAGNIHQDIDRLFVSDAERMADAVAMRDGMPRVNRANEIERLPQAIDNAFGSGNAEADAARLLDLQTSLNKRYKLIKEGPLSLLSPLVRSLEEVPVFKRAMQYAAENDMIRLASASKVPGDWQKTWAAATKLGEGAPLSPTNLLDLHHALVLNAKPPITGATPESVMAGKLKDVLSQAVDKVLKGHKALRADYSAYKRMLEAGEQASKLGSLTGNEDGEAMRFARRILAERAVAERQFNKAEAAWDASFAKTQAGTNKNVPKYTAMNKARDDWAQRAEVVDAFRRRWGENLKRELFTATSPEAAQNVVAKWLSPAGQQRIRMIGGNQADGLLNQLAVLEARNQGRKLSIRGGGDDAAPLTFLDRMTRAGNQDAVDAFRRAWGERLKNELNAKDPNTVGQVVKQLLTPEGKNRILQLLGPDRGKEFIEALYNKMQQMGLGSRLYGNSDTAYKLARQKKLAAGSDLLTSLLPTPWTFSPTNAVRAARELVSNAYTQRRADEMNRLLARQGPEAVSGVIDTVLAGNKSVEMARPYSNVPLTYAAAPVAAGVTSQPGSLPSYGPAKPPIPPYRQ